MIRKQNKTCFKLLLPDAFTVVPIYAMQFAGGLSPARVEKCSATKCVTRFIVIKTAAVISPWVQCTSQLLIGGDTSLFMGNYSVQTRYHKKPVWQLLMETLTVSSFSYQ